MNTRYFNNDVKFYQVIVWNSVFLEKVTILLCALVSWRPHVWVLLEVCTRVPHTLLQSVSVARFWAQGSH